MPTFTVTKAPPLLHHAINNNLIYVFNNLINTTKYVEAQDKTGRFPIHVAIIRNRIEMVKKLVEKNPLCLQFIDCNSKQPFYYAYKLQHLEIIQFLNQINTYFIEEVINIDHPIFAYFFNKKINHLFDAEENNVKKHILNKNFKEWFVTDTNYNNVEIVGDDDDPDTTTTTTTTPPTATANTVGKNKTIVDKIERLKNYYKNYNANDIFNYKIIKFEMKSHHLKLIKYVLDFHKDLKIQDKSENFGILLGKAITFNDENFINYLIENQYEMNSLIENKETILNYALQKNISNETINRLCENHNLLMQVNPVNLQNVFHTVVLTGRLSTIKIIFNKLKEKLFASQPMIVNAPNKMGDTPLLLAVTNNSDLNIIEYLVYECNCDRTIKNNQNGNTILHRIIENNNMEMLEYFLLLANDDDDSSDNFVTMCNNRYEMPLHTAIKLKSLNCVNLLVQWMIEQCIDINKYRKKVRLMMKFVFLAIKVNFPEAIAVHSNYFLKKEFEDTVIDQVYQYNRKLISDISNLHYAICCPAPRYEIIKLLLKTHNHFIVKPSTEKNATLYNSIDLNLPYEIILLLLNVRYSYGINLHIVPYTASISAPLKFVILHKLEYLFKCIFECWHYQIINLTAYMELALSNNSEFRIIHSLFSVLMNTNREHHMFNFNKNQLLRFAINNGNLRFVKQLCEEFHFIDNEMFTPLHYVIENKNPNLDLFEYLIKRKEFNVNLENDDNETVLYLCIKYNRIAFIDIIIKNCRIDEILRVKYKSLNALHLVYNYNRYAILKLLLNEIIGIAELNLIIDEPDDYGCTPIFYAVQNISIEMFNLLMDGKLKPNLFHCDNAGKTILHYAVEVKSIEILKMLLNHLEMGGLRKILDNHKQNLYHYLIGSQFSELGLLFKNFGYKNFTYYMSFYLMTETRTLKMIELLKSKDVDEDVDEVDDMFRKLLQTAISYQSSSLTATFLDLKKEVIDTNDEIIECLFKYEDSPEVLAKFLALHFIIKSKKRAEIYKHFENAGNEHIIQLKKMDSTKITDNNTYLELLTANPDKIKKILGDLKDVEKLKNGAMSEFPLYRWYFLHLYEKFIAPEEQLQISDDDAEQMELA